MYSPLAHWMMALSKDRGTFDMPPTYKAIILHGLSMTEALKVCRHRYRNDLAKLTVEIIAPDVKKIEKDISASFSDQLGVIGESRQISNLTE